MADEPNPSPRPVLPLAEAERPPEPAAYWVNGTFLVMRTNARLPRRCVKCNRPAAAFVQKQLLWSDTRSGPAGGWLRYVPPLGIFFAFQSMFQWFGDLRTAQRPIVSVGLCSRHLLASRLWTALAWLALPVGEALAGSFPNGLPADLGPALFVHFSADWTPCAVGPPADCTPHQKFPLALGRTLKAMRIRV